MHKETPENQGHKTAIGLGIAALAAAVAGTYFLYGSDKASSNRRKMKSWMLRMKAEVMDEVAALKDVTEETYDKTVAKVAEKYKQIKDIDPEEVTALAGRMKGHWNEIRDDIGEVMGGK